MAKLLFITQKIDKDDDILGTYHSWVEKLAKKVDSIRVICLYRGRFDLPQNVEIFPLGKENGPSRFKYVFRFYKYIWSLRKEYENVFVHMNPIYIVLGGVFWKAQNKRIFLWYNHPLGNLTARLGIFFANKVFCTSPYSFSAKYKKTQLMPVGIDTIFFKPMPTVAKKRNRILFLGRISPIKNVLELIMAAKILNERAVDFELLIVGSPASETDRNYFSKVVLAANIVKNIVFKPSVPNHETPNIYNGAGIFVNLTPTGSFDKTILEAMASELPVLVSNAAYKDIFPSSLRQKLMFKEKDSRDLAFKLKNILNDPEFDKIGPELRRIVIEQHGLNKLVQTLTKEINEIKNAP